MLLMLLWQCKQEKPNTLKKVEENNFQTDTLVIVQLLQSADSLKLMLEYDNAFKNYQKAIDISINQKDSNQLFTAYIKTAEMFRAKSDFIQAEDYLKKAQKISTKITISNEELMSYYNRKAALYAEYYQEPDSSLLYSKKAMDVAIKTNETEIIFSSVMEMGFAYENQTKLDSALFYYKKALAIAETEQEKQMECDALSNCCRIYLKQKNYTKGKLLAQRGYKIASNNNLLFSHLIFAQYLSEIAQNEDNYKTAYTYLKERTELTDKYFEKRYDDKIIETEKKYKVAEAEKLTALKELELNEKENALNRQKSVLLIILLLLLASVILLTTIALFNRKINAANKQLNFLNEQNKFLVSETNHRVNNNLQLISVFINQEINKKEDDVALHKLQSYVDSMAILHRHLYGQEDKRLVKLDDYLLEIVSNLAHLMKEKGVELHVKIDNILIDSNQAMYMGLLVNELFINSLKHAFTTANNNKIELNIKTNSKEINLKYLDNGIGIKNEIAPKIISQICKQLKANYRIKSNKGFYFCTAVEV
ncbi:MAG: sensor histidine kinase [Chitinophagales bacterium]